MKKNVLLTFILGLFSTALFAQVTISPATFNVTDQVTITVTFPITTCNGLGASPTKVYMHAGIGDTTSGAFGYSVIGNWGQDNTIGQMANSGPGVYTITITPSTYFGLNATQQANATRMGIVFRNATGTQTLKKAPSCTDFIYNVGFFQTSLAVPAENSTTIINSGDSRTIQASNTNGNANYNLKANGVSINTASDVSTYSFTDTNITENRNYLLEISQGASTQIKKFSVIVNP